MIKQRDIGNFTLNIYRIVRIILVDYSSRRKAKRHRTHWRQNRITTELCVWENLRWQYIMHKIEASCIWCAMKSFWKIKKSLFRTHAPHTRTHPLNDSNPEGNYTKLNATQNRFVHFYFAIYVSNGIMYNIFFALLITLLWLGALDRLIFWVAYDRCVLVVFAEKRYQWKFECFIRTR